MPEIEELVAVGEVKQPGADSVEADFRASGQEISTDVGAACSTDSLLVSFCMALLHLNRKSRPTRQNLPYERRGAFVPIHGTSACKPTEGKLTM